MIFIVLGLDSATAIYFYDSKIEEDRITILSTSLIFRFLFSTLFTIIVLIFAQNLSILLFSDNIYTFFFILSFLSIPFQNIFKIFLEILRLKIKPLLYSILSFLNVLLSFLLILLLLLFYKMRIEGIFVSYLLSYVTFSLLGFIFVRKYIKLEFDFSALSKMLKFGIPLIPASLAIWVLTYANRLILQIMTNSYEVGLFSLATKIASIILLVVSAFQLAWAPYAFSIQHETDSKVVYSRILNYYLIISLFLGLGLSLFSKEVLIFFTTPEYIPSHKIVFLIILFYSFNGMASIVSIGVHLLKKSIVITISTIVSSIMNVILCILLIPFFGIMGAAFAIMVGSLINVIILFSINQKIYNTPFHKKKICGIFLLFLAIVLISQEIQIDEIIYSLLFKSILILIFIGGLFKIKMITQREVSFLKEIFRKYYSIIG